MDRCPLLAETLRRWRREGEDGLCEACREPEDATHYITDCMKYIHPRIIHLGPTPNITVLQEDPEGVMKFIRATGLLRAARPSA